MLATLVGAGEAGDRFIVVDLRLPRALVAAGAGAALALAAGAAAAGIPVAAFAGAVSAAALMYLPAWREGLSPFRLVLVGIGIAAVARRARPTCWCAGGSRRPSRRTCGWWGASTCARGGRVAAGAGPGRAGARGGGGRPDRLRGVHGPARGAAARPGAGSGRAPAAALCGATLVPAADLAGRAVLAPTELPVGIVTSLLGAPFFLALLLWRANR